MGASGKCHFDYFVQRLTVYSEERAAKTLLKELGQNGSISREKAFDIFEGIINKDYEIYLDVICFKVLLRYGRRDYATYIKYQYQYT